MFPRKKLFPLLFVSLTAAVAFVGGACKSSRAEADRTAAQSAAPVIRVTPTPAAAGESISIAAVGDTMLGSTAQGRGLPVSDGAEMISGLTPIISSTDIAFANLEGAMIDGGTQTKCGPNSKFCYTFSMPTRYARYLKEAGFDVVSLANNHSSDFGAEGRASTRKAVEAVGLLHSGGDVNDVAYMTVKGRKIALLAFAFNPISLNLLDIENSRRVVAEAARKADIVIVSFHGGAEGSAAQHVPRGPETYLGSPRGDLRAFTHAVIDAGADLLLGHSPHVVRGMEVYKNRLIVYSLGNFAFYRFPFNGPTALSLILETNIGPQGEFLSGKIHPLLQEGQSGPRPDKNGTATNVIRQLSKDDFGPTAVKITEDGTISSP
ncbi:MAG TPA: CapA family protein [Pyrinomonadaceae bacterium]|nr:CapA family protein [Pyrinomonadaceae bacterium]